MTNIRSQISNGGNQGRRKQEGKSCHRETQWMEMKQMERQRDKGTWGPGNGGSREEPGRQMEMNPSLKQMQEALPPTHGSQHQP